MNCIKQRPYEPTNTNIIAPDYAYLLKTTHFHKYELEELLKKYEVICDDANGTLSKEVFLDLTSATFCPLITFCFDKELDSIATVAESLIDFTSFVETLSVFSSRAGSSEKKLYLFDLLKGSPQSTGITKEEFEKLFLCMVAGNVNALSAAHLFDQIWVNAVASEKGDRIAFQHFTRLISDYDLRSFMTFDLL
jgi:Ca2+-binding EF-hand superfamily protein